MGHDIHEYIKRLIRVASNAHQDKKTDRLQNDKDTSVAFFNFSKLVYRVSSIVEALVLCAVKMQVSFLPLV